MEEPQVKDILVTILLHDVYSVDETRVLKQTLPDRIMAFKNGCVFGVEMSSERFCAFNLCWYDW